MGALAITVTKTTPGGLGDHNIVEGTFTFSTSYATGGDTFTLADLKLKKLTILLPQTCKSGNVFEADETNLKVKAYQVAGHSHTENTAATYTQNASTASIAAAALSEVAAATNLSTIGAVKFIAIGT